MCHSLLTTINYHKTRVYGIVKENVELTVLKYWMFLKKKQKITTNI